MTAAGRKGNWMKVRVDQKTCIGCGLCVDTCPAVFKMDGNTAVVKVDPVPPADQASCQDAANGCPVNAIFIEEE